MISINLYRVIAYFRKSVYAILISATVAFFGLSSCNKGTEFDNYANNSYNKISYNVPASPDSIGVDVFLSDKYLGLSIKEQRLLMHTRNNGLYEIMPFALPEADDTAISLSTTIKKTFFDCSYSNFFYGYPIAIKTNSGTIVVAEKRVSETKTNQFSDGVMLTQDANSDWNETDFFKYAAYGISWNVTRPLMGTLPDGRIVIKGKGLLVSDGDFQNWKHYPYAFKGLVKSGKSYHDCGPTMTYSSKFGLFFGTGQANSDTATLGFASLFSVDPDNGVVSLVKSRWVPKFMNADSTYFYISSLDMPSFYSVEHSDFTANKYDIVGLGVSQFGRIYQYIYNYKEGDTFDSIKFQMSLTNISGSLVRQSPISIDYNPFTKRFEAIVSAPDQIALYSIAPSDLLNNVTNRVKIAQWTYETTLLNRDVSIRGQGMYPVSSIIDEVSNTQTIFIHAGMEYPARSGLFTIKRTLDTPKLSQFVNTYRAYLSNVTY